MQIPGLSTQSDLFLSVQSTDKNKSGGAKTGKSGSGEEDTTSTQAANDTSLSGYNQMGQVTGVDNNDKKDGGVFAKREQIKNEVLRQSYSMLQEAIAQFISSGSSKDSADSSTGGTDQTADPFGLGAYYAAHPADWQKVQQGVVPDYFNIENTAKRILDIWLPQGGTQDKETLQNARQNIESAYSEVSKMFGGKLPQLVLDTRDYILKKLDDMATAEPTPTGEQA